MPKQIFPRQWIRGNEMRKINEFFTAYKIVTEVQSNTLAYQISVCRRDHISALPRKGPVVTPADGDLQNFEIFLMK